MSDRPFLPDTTYELKHWRQGCAHVAGVDEAGRGCLAGPVVAAAVIFPEGCVIEGINDSKQLTHEIRCELLEEIRACALAIGVGVCTVEEIDRLNILWASMEAMRRAVHSLPLDPHMLLIDGNRCFPGSEWPFETVIGGDALCHCIAAASIVAKVTRDRMMISLHDQFPQYDWANGKGYATPAHWRALNEHGPSPLHRQSFRLYQQPELFSGVPSA